MCPSLALIGCGAIAQHFYLPSLARDRARFGSLWLADPCIRSLEAAGSMIASKQCSRISEIDEAIDLAIIATPNATHFALAAEALSRGAHVLVEKPFVLDPSEGSILIDLARRGNRVLAVNQTRRFFPFVAELRSRIRCGEFGLLQSIAHQEGVKLAWPFESGAAFAPSAQRTGSIMDFGVHVIDFYHFLLDPDWSLASAIHDGFDGPEGLAEINLLASGIPVSIRLSRYCQQENTAHMLFERAEVSFNIHGADGYTVRWREGPQEHCAHEAPEQQGVTLADRVLLNFMAAAEGREIPVCSAESTLPVIEILDDIYREAETYEATPGYV
jgi:predicted dehydrogenase